MGGHVKGAINVPLGETAAVRAVAYATGYAGFIDAIGPAGGKDVNGGNRLGGRISLLWQPVEELKITPRVVYQKVEADGFNREECYNLYLNEFTTAGRRWIWQARRNICCCARSSKTKRCLPT